MANHYSNHRCLQGKNCDHTYNLPNRWQYVPERLGSGAKVVHGQAQDDPWSVVGLHGRIRIESQTIKFRIF